MQLAWQIRGTHMFWLKSMMETSYLEDVRTDGRILKLALHRMCVDSKRVAEDRELWPTHVHKVTYFRVA